jgi:hypothetical protein
MQLEGAGQGMCLSLSLRTHRDPAPASQSEFVKGHRLSLSLCTPLASPSLGTTVHITALLPPNSCSVRGKKNTVPFSPHEDTHPQLIW